MNSLEQLFTLDGMLEDINADNYSDKLRGKILLRRDASLSEKKAAINLCVRLGYESMAINLPIVDFWDTAQDVEGTNIIIELNEGTYGMRSDTVNIELRDSNVVISASNLDALELGGLYLAGRWPNIGQLGENVLTLNAVKERIQKHLRAEEVLISKAIVDKNHLGLASLVVEVHISRAIKETACFIKENLGQFVWDSIEEITLKLCNGENFCNVTVQNEAFAPSKVENCSNKSYSETVIRDKNVDIASLLSTEGILVDTDNDFLPDSIDTRIVIPDNASDHVLLAASIVATRLGLESLGVAFPFVYSEQESTDLRNPFYIGRFEYGNSSSQEESQCTLQVNQREDDVSIMLSGEGQSLVSASHAVATKLSQTNSGLDLQQMKEDFDDAIASKNEVGQLAYLLAQLDSIENFHGSVESYMSLDALKDVDIEVISDHLKKRYGLDEVTICSYKDREEVWQRNYEFVWEVDTLRHIMKTKLYPALKSGDRVEILGTLSEDKSMRDELRQEICTAIEERGAVTTKCEILCAYKQGLSWITEVVLPYLHEQGLAAKVSGVIIEFKPLLPQGKEEWDDEDGAIPNINAQREDNNKWFDLPIRFLQELYPVDDLVAKDLGINRERITFEVLNGDIDTTYRLTFIDANEEVVYTDSFAVRYSERPYLDEYPAIGTVHPNTGWVRVWVNGELAIEEAIRTDLEQIWDVYQSDILTQCKQYVLETTNYSPTIDKQPFFSELRMEISASEPDYRLGVRQDLISSLDALHEDMYFVGLDFFKTFGSRTVGQRLDAPGIVLPWIKKVNGSGATMQATLYKEKYPNPQMILDGQVYPMYQEVDCSLEINQIVFEGDDVKEITIAVHLSHANQEQKVNAQLKSLVDLFSIQAVRKTFSALGNISFTVRINLVVGNEFKQEYVLNASEYQSIKEPESNEALSIDDIDIPVGEVIGYEQYRAIIEQLKRVKELSVWDASQSYQGRDIYAVDITRKFASDLVSRTKLINANPVFLINNRHHANEVAASTAAFKLIKELYTNEELKSYLSKLSIAIIPFENVDGGNLHYELQRENPEWKLHVARYNSVGRDIAYDYFNSDSKYTESRALPRVWRKWLPDLMVDNHGVPSHEWDQQFSGYASPWFKGFWLPRALFYGCMWYVDSEEYPKHKELNERLAAQVAQCMNKDEEIRELNLEWRDRFTKYANRWLPKCFPADYTDNVIFTWYAYKPNKDAWHVSHRYPWITAIDWTTEVADETAQGDYLELCARATHTSNVATIDLLAKSMYGFDEVAREEQNAIVLKRVRVRPCVF